MFGLVIGCYAVRYFVCFLGTTTLMRLQNQAFLPISTSSIPLILLDPTGAESHRCSAFTSLSCIPALGTITNVEMRGIVSPEVFEKVIHPSAVALFL